MPTRTRTAAAATPPRASAERPSPASSRRPPPTASDTRRPAESVRVTDNPAGSRGRAFLVERELEQDGNGALQALVGDYLEQAERHGVIPMLVPLGRYLAHIDE
jgi:hypothetical protein